MKELGQLVADIVERNSKEQAAFLSKLGRDCEVAVERFSQFAQAVGAQTMTVLRDLGQKPPSG